MLLTVLDRHWREHLYEMDYLQEGIGLRAIGQRDPWSSTSARASTCSWPCRTPSSARPAYVFNASIQVVDEDEQRRQAPAPPPTQLTSAATEAEQAAAAPPSPQRPAGKKVGRNQPCPCGSGKKYKLCHGAATPAPEPTGGVPTTTRRRPSFI